MQYFIAEFEDHCHVRENIKACKFIAYKNVIHQDSAIVFDA